MKLHIAGGCGEHGRNCFQVEGHHAKFLVDCGVMAGEEGGGYPRLTSPEIRSCQCLFLTHSHADHTGALPWLRQQGYTGPVVASRHTLDQLPFHVEAGIALEEICPNGAGTYQGIQIQWGRSGHCVGSVWYRFTTERKTVLFSGDYTEDTQVYAFDPIRDQRADLAVLDCAYGLDSAGYGTCCDRLLARTAELMGQYPLLLFPVPKYGRGLELLRLFQTAGLPATYYGDDHFLCQLEQTDGCQKWYKSSVQELSQAILPYTGGETTGIVFVSDPQLRAAPSHRIAEAVLARGGYGIMTGTVENGTYSAQLLQQESAELLRYPVHLNHPQYELLKEHNAFAHTVPYHTADFQPEPVIAF